MITLEVSHYYISVNLSSATAGLCVLCKLNRDGFVFARGVP